MAVKLPSEDYYNSDNLMTSIREKRAIMAASPAIFAAINRLGLSTIEAANFKLGYIR